jgi:diaminopimelate epimerase
MRYTKYHGLGNDYIVIRPEALDVDLTTDAISRICHRNFGIGSDGILLGPTESNVSDFGVRIFNPDGSEAENSGNGLRIFARFLWDHDLVQTDPFTVETPGGVAECRVLNKEGIVRVEMGTVSFDSAAIPVSGPVREVLNEEMQVDGRPLNFCAATVGNPHCIVLCEAPTADDARRWGPLIEVNDRFPNRTNVQFMQVVNRNTIKIEIWERGAGYTLASGTSSTAAAATAHRLGLCDSEIDVQMPGGSLHVQFRDGFVATLTGPVTKICDGDMSNEIFGGRH